MRSASLVKPPDVIDKSRASRLMGIRWSLLPTSRWRAANHWDGKLASSIRARTRSG